MQYLNIQIFLKFLETHKNYQATSFANTGRQKSFFCDVFSLKYAKVQKVSRTNVFMIEVLF